MDGTLISAENIELFKTCYRTNNWKFNSERIGDEETLYAMLPLEDLLEFAEKSEAKGAASINIYFGVFPTPFPDYSLLAGRITFCFVGVNNQGDGVYFGEDQPDFGIGGYNNRDQVEIFKENYRLKRLEYNSQAIGKTDSVGATCLLKTLKNFLLGKQDANFIRIYIGAYPDNYDPVPSLSKMQTIVLVTMKEGSDRIAREILNGDDAGLNMFPVL